MNIFMVNYADLESNEKKQMCYDFSINTQESCKEFSNNIQVLAQLTFINRVFNSYNKALVQAGKKMSMLISDGINLLWDYLENKCSKESFEKFSNGINAISLYINTGDKSEFEDNYEFVYKYLDEWNGNIDLIMLLNTVASLFFQISQENIDFYSISEDCILGELQEVVAECFEDVYTNLTGGYKYDELELRMTQICESDTFVKIMSLLLQDMKEAVKYEGKDIEEIKKLRKKYEKELLFPSVETEELAKYFKEEI